MAAGDVEVSIATPDARQCAKFDGVDDYSVISGGTNFSINTSMSISFWVRSTAVAGLVVSKNDYGLNKRSWNIGATGGGKIAIGLYDNGTQTTYKNYESSLIAFNGLWHFVTTTYNGTDYFIYVDAVLDHSVNKIQDSPIISIYPSTVNPSIGSRFNSGTPVNFFNGTIDEVRIYNRALSADEVAKLYGGIHITDGLVGYWPLKSDYLDYSGNGNNGTNTGSVLVTSDGPVSKAIADKRVNSSDRYFAIDVAGGQQIITGRIQEA